MGSSFLYVTPRLVPEHLYCVFASATGSSNRVGWGFFLALSLPNRVANFDLAGHPQER